MVLAKRGCCETEGDAFRKVGMGLNSELKEKELFESMPILRAVMKLAVPTVIGQIILVVYNMADTYFIGQTNDNCKVAAVTVIAKQPRITVVAA